MFPVALTRASAHAHARKKTAGRVSLIPLKIEAKEEIFPLNNPFRISRGSRTEACVITVSVSDGQYTGRGEVVPIARYDQSIDSVFAQIESIQIIDDLDRDKLQQLLPAGAAKDAAVGGLKSLRSKFVEMTDSIPSLQNATQYLFNLPDLLLGVLFVIAFSKTPSAALASPPGERP